MSSLLRVESLSVAKRASHSLDATAQDADQLLRQVSFNVEDGERVGLIGESGSGKSLTALAIIGLLPDSLLQSGSVNFAGREISSLSNRELQKLRGREIAVVFQEPATALDPLMKVGKQVAEPIRRHFGLRGSDLRRSVISALDEVQLANALRIADSYPHEISGGERQRVAIAAAIACKPRLLITDEPTTALDVTVQREILKLIQNLVTERSMSLVFITHDLAVVAQVVDRILVMRRGEIVENLSVHQLSSAPAHPYTQELLKSARLLDSALGA
ncbi:MAG TPA: ABC transporter ATP-binding protein [Candidatus Nanopelagicaceae bacterium]|nr:ABC transporter ATP-binding protein [Candidatus Nanopelagicaceae bacterium]